MSITILKDSTNADLSTGIVSIHAALVPTGSRRNPRPTTTPTSTSTTGRIWPRCGHVFFSTIAKGRGFGLYL
jgi:hypothetical protein